VPPDGVPTNGALPNGAPAGALPNGALAGAPAIRLEHAAVGYGERRIWEGLDLTVPAGEFLAVLGPNGAGKTTLLKVVLGLERPSGGLVEVEGRAPRRGSKRIGYIPQQRAFDRDLPVRGRDLVRFGLDGHRLGVLLARRESRRRVDEVIDAVGATAFAGAPVGRLSGGEQQRLRIAQALLGDPAILLCDEPLLSLDVAHQRIITALIDQRRRRAGTTIVFVTHDINPVLPYVDRVLYLVGGRFAVGSPDEILTGARLSSLYGTEVDVVRAGGRVVVVSPDDDELGGAGDGHHPPAVCPPETWED
jgi:zinc/manganese transport system ATP-binding protein